MTRSKDWFLNSLKDDMVRDDQIEIILGDCLSSTVKATH
mgnify:CR=1 FL=1